MMFLNSRDESSKFLKNTTPVTDHAPEVLLGAADKSADVALSKTMQELQGYEFSHQSMRVVISRLALDNKR